MRKSLLFVMLCLLAFMPALAQIGGDYNPVNPPNPNRNYWDKEAKEIIMDDFTPGKLVKTIQSTIINGVGLNDVLSIVVGGKMMPNDFGVVGINGCKNCTWLDLSRVTEVYEIPSSAFNNTNLENVHLPKTIQRIGNNAFAGCKKLAYLTLYTSTPPKLDSNVFKDVSNTLVVFVPSYAVDAYQNNDAWGNFVILPIQGNVQSVTVELPKNTDVKEFGNIWVELTNVKSSQQMHYVITDRMQYTFSNLSRNTTWKAVLRNEMGDVFGTIDNIEVKDKDLTVSFASLLKPQNISLVVQTPEGKDVTSHAQVTWLDSLGHYITQGSLLKGKPAGCKVSYAVVLDKELSMIYSAPSVNVYSVRENTNNLTCKLVPIRKVKVSGRLIDAETKLPISDGVVSVSQMFNKKYGKVQNVKSGDDGRFAIELKSVPTSLTFTNNNYVSQTLVCDSLMNGSADVALSDVLLKIIKGATVSIEFKYTDVTGESRKWYDDFHNIDYEL